MAKASRALLRRIRTVQNTRRITKTMELVSASKLKRATDRVAAARKERIPTPELNRFLEKATTAHPPVSKDRRDVRILYGVQTGITPPEFVLFTNVATELHFSYQRYLTNQLRDTFGFEGTPIRLTVRRRSRKG